MKLALRISCLILAAMVLIKSAVGMAYYLSVPLPLPVHFRDWVNVTILLSGGFYSSLVLMLFGGEWFRFANRHRLRTLLCVLVICAVAFLADRVSRKHHNEPLPVNAATPAAQATPAPVIDLSGGFVRKSAVKNNK